MIPCPWCGTHHDSFQSTCSQCGGTLPRPPDETAGAEGSDLRVPPAPPRQVPRRYVRRILSTDAVAIVAGIFCLLGATFLAVGLGVIFPAVIAVVGLVFTILGLCFLGVGLPLMAWRHGRAKGMADILREGTAVLGEIVGVYQSYHIQVNGCFPWSVVYRFRAEGQEMEGKVSTLSEPDLSHQAGEPVSVLYERDNPARSTIYPHPYGYYGL